MARIVILEGRDVGREFLLDQECSLISRNPDAPISVPSPSIGRRHAQVWSRDGAFFVEDLGSVNGTVLNGERIAGRKPLADGDRLKVGDCVLAFYTDIAPPSGLTTILEQVDPSAANTALFAENPEHKLQTVLVLAQDLGQALELDPLLDQLLENLLRLFPLADRGLVVLCEGDRFTVRAHRSRRRGDTSFPFSRTVIRAALEAGRGILSEDAHGDQRFHGSSTLSDVETTSLLCVPLLGHDGQPLGAVQLDCLRPDQAFTGEHLRLLATVCLLAAAVVENVALNAVRRLAAALRRDLALGREIQFGFLPTDFTPPAGSGCEVFAAIHPAKDVSGDLYDFFPLGDGRLAFLVGDVSDKGIPAALFMVKVQTLVRHLAAVTASPAQTLTQLNTALALHNPSSMFVTLVLGLYDPRTGEATLASGGHPRPLLRRPDGRVAEVAMPVGALLGCFETDPLVADMRLTLGRGETLILFSDGYTEAAAAGTRKMFGLESLKAVLGGPQATLPLPACADKARQAVERYIGGADLQDDLTLLLFRRT
jgi:serine phosphatase RsbU (regulator of sigma subunit)